MDNNFSNIIRKQIFSVADKAMRTSVMHYYNEINKMQHWSKSEIQNWQNLQLQNLVKHAYNNTEYYKDLFDKNGLKPDDIKTSNDIKKIPIITRRLISANFQRLIPNNIIEIPHKKATTGGSTGEPLNYLLDKRSWSFTNANYIVNWEKSKYSFGDRYIALGSNSIFAGESESFKHKIYYKLKNKISLNGMSMTDDICDKYIDVLKVKKVKFIYGYASAIYLLAKYVKKKNIDLSMLGCFTTAEVLTDFYRETIEKAFKCTIINCYGANDGGITAFEHVKDQFNVGYNTIVSIDHLNRISNNERPLLTTNLLNYAMPLINYEVGDVIKMNGLKGNYNGQVIEKIHGRTTDILKLENGTTITTIGFYTNIFNNVPVEAYKLKKGEMNEIICEIKRKPNFKPVHKDRIISVLNNFIGKGAKVKIEFKDDFNTSKSGKKDYTITG